MDCLLDCDINKVDFGFVNEQFFFCCFGIMKFAKHMFFEMSSKKLTF